jgi:hypothetical protein
MTIFSAFLLFLIFVIWWACGAQCNLAVPISKVVTAQFHAPRRNPLIASVLVAVTKRSTRKPYFYHHRKVLNSADAYKHICFKSTCAAHDVQFCQHVMAKHLQTDHISPCRCLWARFHPSTHILPLFRLGSHLLNYL